MALTLSKEVKVGLFSLFGGAALYVGVNFLKGSDMLSRSQRIHAVFKDVGGLVVSNPVIVNGLSVGRIKELKLVGQTEHAVLATLEIDSKDLPLYKGLTCTLVSTDFLGGKAIRLNMEKHTGTLLAQDDTIPAETEKGITEEISAKVSPMLANLDSVSSQLKVLLRSFRNTSKVLEGTLTSFKNTSDATSGLLAANQANIHSITGNASVLTEQLVKTEKELDLMVRKFNRFGDSLNQVHLASTVTNLNKTVSGLNGVLSDVNAGKGSLGKLTKNDSLYANLNKSSEALDALLKDMKARPSRYIHFSVFGKKDKS